MSDIQDQQTPASGVEETDDEIWSRRLAVLWRYRRVLAGAGAAGILACLLLVWLTPSESYSSLKFRLLFDGAEKGEYPSGVRFSTNDVISRAVLDDAYRTFSLDPYGSMEEFQQAFYVAAKPSPEMQALDAEFTGKLAGKLTAVERSQLEKEYLEKKAGLVNSVEWSLALLTSSGIGRRMPSQTREKVLQGVLNAWADDAATRKGALQYQIDVLSKNILPPEIIQDEDFFVAADMLRLKLDKIRKNIDQILLLPGAKTYRSASNGNMSLGEIRSNLDDLLRFRLVPLMHWIRAFGVSEKKDLTRLYIESGIENLTLDKKAASDRARVLEESLLAYSQERRRSTSATGAAPPPRSSEVPAMIPQFGDSFLDRIIELAGRNDDVKFRQQFAERMSQEALKEVEIDKDLSLYKDMLKALEGQSTSTRPASFGESTSKTVKERLDKVYGDLVQYAERVEAIFNEIAGRNLNPRTHIFSTWEPVTTQVVRSMSALRLAAYCVLLFAVVMMAACAGCLGYDRWRRG